MENGIRKIRLEMGMTQQAFADMLECSQGNVGHYELRDQMVPPEVARKLIAEAARRGSRFTYEDIYGVVHHVDSVAEELVVSSPDAKTQ